MRNVDPANWIEAANTLAEILQTENAALQANHFSAATALLPAKRAAIHAVERFTPEGPKPVLREAARQLDNLAADNRKLLLRSINVQSQVVGIIAAAARTASAFGYGSSGQTSTRNQAFTLSSKA